MSEQTRLYSGPETPDGAVLAEPGSVFLRNVDGAGSFYYKEQGDSADGWIPITLSGGGGGGGGASAAGTAGTHQLSDGSGGFLASKLIEFSADGTTTMQAADSVLVSFLIGDGLSFYTTIAASPTASSIIVRDSVTPRQIGITTTGISDSAQNTNALTGWDSSWNLASIPGASFDGNTGAIALNIHSSNSNNSPVVAASILGAYLGNADAGGATVGLNLSAYNSSPFVGDVTALNIIADATDGGGTSNTSIGISVGAGQIAGAPDGNNFAIQIGDMRTAADFSVKTGIGSCEFGGTLQVDGNVGFYGTTPAAQPTVSGAKADAVAASILAGLVSMGLVADSTT